MINFPVFVSVFVFAFYYIFIFSFTYLFIVKSDIQEEYTDRIIYWLLGYEKSEDTKGIIISRKSRKYRQCNGQAKKGNRTNNDIQNNTEKTKDWTIWTQLKTGVELRYSGRINSSCFTSGTRRVTLVKLTMISSEKRNAGLDFLYVNWTYPWSSVTDMQ